MGDWDDDEFEVDNAKAGPRTDKWDGEDEDDDIKDAWDAESDEEGKEKKPVDENASVGKVQKKKKKKLAEIIAEKEEARLREMEEEKMMREEENQSNTQEGILAEKLRRQKIVEDGDFELTRELLGGEESSGTGGINFNPDSEAGFEELRTILMEKFNNIENSEHYQDFATLLMKDMCMGLPVASLKKVKADCEGFISVKLKDEKAARAKKAKVGTAKATIKMETDRSMFSRGMDEGYNDMDDFM